MKKHIVDESIDNRCIDIDSKRRIIEVDMSKHGILQGDFAVEVFSFLIIRTSLIPLSFQRMFRIVMFLIHINSKTVRSCHFRRFFGALTRFLWVRFWFKVNTETTSPVFGQRSIILRSYLEICSVRKRALEPFIFSALSIDTKNSKGWKVNKEILKR